MPAPFTIHLAEELQALAPGARMLRLAAGYVVYMKSKASFEYHLIPVKMEPRSRE